MLPWSNRAAVKPIIIHARPFASLEFAEAHKTKLCFALYTCHMFASIQMIDDKFAKYADSENGHFVLPLDSIMNQNHFLFRAFC